MQKKTFKDYLQADLYQTFFNEDEFATTISVNGKPVAVIKDDDKLSDYNSKLSEGLVKCELLFYAPVSNFESNLFVGKVIAYNNKRYLIENLLEDDGMYTILLVGMSQ